MNVPSTVTNVSSSVMSASIDGDERFVIVHEPLDQR